MECSLDQIWDLNLMWNADVPDFSDCFKATILIPLPSLLFGIFAVFEFRKYFSQNHKTPYPLSGLFLAKVALCVILIILSGAELLAALQKMIFDQQFHNTTLFVACWKLITYIAVLSVLFLHRSIGCKTSNMFFIFWFLQSISTILIHRSSFLKACDKTFPFISSEEFIIDMLYCPLIYSQLILSIFSEKDTLKDKSPMEEETFFLFITYIWLDKIIFRNRRNSLSHCDLTPLPLCLKSAYSWVRFQSKWVIKRSFGVLSDAVIPGSSKLHSLPVALTRAFFKWIIYYILLEIIRDIISFLPAIFLGLILDALNEKYAWRGYFYCGALIVSACLTRLSFNLLVLYSGLSALQIKSALMIAIYRKVLKMSPSARKDTSSGEMMNLMAVDVDKIYKFVQFASLLFGSPLKIILSMIFLWHYLGPACLAGVAVLVILMPLSLLIGKRFSSTQQKQMEAKDCRLKHITEIIYGIKVLKLFAWEIPFMQKINVIREREVKLIKKLLYYYAASSFIWGCAPFLIAIACFITYVLVDARNVLSATMLFVSLNIINTLRYSLFVVSDITSQLAQVRVSLKRMNSFFLSEDCDMDAVGSMPDKDQSITFRHASLTWVEKDCPTLQDINLQIPKGSLVAIVGTVGSGKSSLLSAMLGDMIKVSGSIDLSGSLAYVPQQAWILNQTLQQNIIFKKLLNTEVYENVIYGCCLEQDISQLPGGNQTEIGEKGVNLSGGQKQRISLARAVYQNSDVYLLDDPLSSVDAHVGKHIFENVIGNAGILKDKTRIIVTHNISVLPFVDMIICMRNGKIEDSGTFTELIEKDGPFSDFIKMHGKGINENNGKEVNHIHNEESVEAKFLGNEKSDMKKSLSSHSMQEKFGQLIEEEKTATGKVKWEMYGSYIKHAGIHILLPSVFCYGLYQAFEIWANISLSHWSSTNTSSVHADMSTKYHQIGTVLILGLLQVISVICGNVLMAIAAAKASEKYHKEMLYSFMRAPLIFYDTTPHGRIMNRCSKDIDIIDTDIPFALDGFLACMFQVLGIFVVIGMTTPIFLPCLLPLAISYYFLQKWFLISSRELKRLESVSRSPVYSYFQETIQGVSSIRSYCMEDKFIADFESKIDTSISCSYHWFISTRWIAVRLDILSIIIISLSAFLAVYNQMALGVASVGLSLVYTLSITNALTWIVRNGTELENNAISIERIDEYSNLPSEAAWDLPENKLPLSWPEAGCITFKDYSTSYRSDLDFVLKKLNLNISAEEKVGIVGRTGAGKSSLTLALFRIIEPVYGTIELDGFDVSKLGLHALRSKLTIIPQEPVLFSGSLRSNVDPNNEYMDDAIWISLEQAHLKKFFASIPDGLSFEIAEGGENLSVGQRQLICLARALLKKTKILVLDEATAAVDMETDSLIQNTIRAQFQNCTVITVAHRLNTIMDCDTILVMESGQLVESGKPKDLLKNEDSRFFSLVKNTAFIKQ